MNRQQPIEYAVASLIRQQQQTLNVPTQKTQKSAKNPRAPSKREQNPIQKVQLFFLKNKTPRKSSTFLRWCVPCGQQKPTVPTQKTQKSTKYLEMSRRYPIRWDEKQNTWCSADEPPPTQPPPTTHLSTHLNQPTAYFCVWLVVAG